MHSSASYSKAYVEAAHNHGVHLFPFTPGHGWNDNHITTVYHPQISPGIYPHIDKPKKDGWTEGLAVCNKVGLEPGPAD